LTVTVERDANPLFAIESAIDELGLRLERILIQPGYAPDEDRLDIILSRPRVETLDALLDHLRRVSGVRQISSVRAPGPARGLPVEGHLAEEDDSDED
jgi:hypothetical protein